VARGPWASAQGAPLRWAVAAAELVPREKCYSAPMPSSPNKQSHRRKIPFADAGLRHPYASAGLHLVPIPGMPEIHKGENLSKRIWEAAVKTGLRFEEGDILVVAQKIVSKAEGAVVRLKSVKPSAKAQELAAPWNKDPRLVELVLRESRRVLRSGRVLIVETRQGFVCANAGIDHSNVPGEDAVTLLPKNPDGSARKLAAALCKASGKRIAVIISDTFGRPWRLGLTNVAIGGSGLAVLRDLRGSLDRQGKPLTATILAVADELAAAAGLLMGKTEGTPVVLIRGYRYAPSSETAASIIRPASEDLFR
jgi:coenzyme F420-0:L-glutamate ligase/coenzyme F420-1:gamma-L-glutamate ligase